MVLVGTGVILILASIGAAQEVGDPGPRPARDGAPAGTSPSPRDEPESEVEPEGESDHGSGGGDADSDDEKEASAEPDRPKRRPGRRVVVSRVIDGDTIEVMLDGAPQALRLIGFDTPETVHPTQPVECFGRAASDYTTSKLEGRRVRLEFDVERRDHYGRLLGYVWLDRSLFNEKIVRDGFAQIATYPPNVRYVDEILRAQRAARSAGRGLWSSCPADGTGSSTGDGSNEAGGGEAIAGGGKCTPGYDPCLAPAEDYDCAGGSGNGPEYATGPIRVSGDDPYELDSNGDGVACE